MTSELRQNSFFLEMHGHAMQSKYTAHAPDMDRSQRDHLKSLVSSLKSWEWCLMHRCQKPQNETNRVAATLPNFKKHRPSNLPTDFQACQSTMFVVFACEIPVLGIRNTDMKAHSSSDTHGNWWIQFQALQIRIAGTRAPAKTELWTLVWNTKSHKQLHAQTCKLLRTVCIWARIQARPAAASVDLPEIIALNCYLCVGNPVHVNGRPAGLGRVLAILGLHNSN